MRNLGRGDLNKIIIRQTDRQIDLAAQDIGGVEHFTCAKDGTLSSFQVSRSPLQKAQRKGSFLGNMGAVLLPKNLALT